MLRPFANQVKKVDQILQTSIPSLLEEKMVHSRWFKPLTSVYGRQLRQILYLFISKLRLMMFNRSITHDRDETY